MIRFKSTLIALVILLAVGCTESAFYEPDDQSAAMQPSQQELQFVNLLPETKQDLGKWSSYWDSHYRDKDSTADTSKVATAWISSIWGGRLKFSFDGEDYPAFPEWQNTTLRATLDVRAGAIDRSQLISLEIGHSALAGNFAMHYEPHGLVFEQDAILNIEASGLNFSRLSAAALNNLAFYYINQESGFWEPMPYEDLIIDADSGYLKLINAKLPHFSRYAIAHSR